MQETLKKYFKGDPVIWAVILSLSIISLLAVYSSIGSLAYRSQHHNTTYYLIKHFTFQFIGLAVVYVMHLIPYKYYSRFSQLLITIAVPLLLITLFFGETRNQANRWIELPGFGITIQSSDLAKLALIMFVARLLSLKQASIKDYKSAFLPIIGITVLVCMLILPSNLSTALILFATTYVLMFIGRINFKHLAVFGILVIFLLSMFIMLALNVNWEGRIGTWRNRIENFVDKDSGDNFQIEQSKIAIATGGIIGKGPGKSVQKNIIPYSYSDFIFAIIAEEYGLIGSIFVIFLYLYLFFRAGILVRRSNRTFPAFLAIGLALLLVFQAIVNMAVAVGLLPVTGQTLPFVSRGGTSMLITAASFGIMLSVSRGIQKANLQENE